jgi:hypothetical protein
MDDGSIIELSRRKKDEFFDRMKKLWSQNHSFLAQTNFILTTHGLRRIRLSFSFNICLTL